MSLEKQVRKVVQEQLGGKRADVDAAETLADLGADSLDEVELVMALEEEFNIEIPDDVGENFENIAEIIGYITEAQGE